MVLLVANPEPPHDFVESAGFRFGSALLVQEDTKLAGGRHHRS